MPSIEDWKKENKKLLDAIDEYQEGKLISPYTILKGIAQAMITGASIIKPETKALEWIVKGLTWLGNFLKKYSEKQDANKT